MRKIYIWGMGDDAVRLINKYPIVMAMSEGFIDSDERKWGENLKKLVLDPNAIDYTDESVWIVIATSRYKEEIISYLKERRFEHYSYFRDEDLLEVLFSDYSMNIHSKAEEYKRLYTKFPYMSADFARNLADIYVYQGRIVGDNLFVSLGEIMYGNGVFNILVLTGHEFDKVRVIQRENLLAEGKMESILQLPECCREGYIKAIHEPQDEIIVRIQLVKNDQVMDEIHCSDCKRTSCETMLLKRYAIVLEDSLLFKPGETIAIITEDSSYIGKFAKYYHVADISKTKKCVVGTDNWEMKIRDLKERGYQALPYWIYFIAVKGGVDFRKMCEISEFLGVTVADMMKYIRYNCGSKEILMVYGNCQSRVYNSLMITSDELLGKYILVHMVYVQHCLEFVKYMTKEFFQEIDLFIYQNVSKENRFSMELSTDVITSYLRTDARKVCIPNAYFVGYFPQVYNDPYNVVLTKFGKYAKAFANGDRNIREMTDTGMTAGEIAGILKGDEFYTKEEVKRHVEKSLNELREKEKICDVTISDFIEKWYRKRQLFYTHNHPTCFLCNEILQRAFALLKEEFYFDIEKGYDDIQCELFIYPSVAKALDLPFVKEKYCYWNKIDENPSDMEHYVEAYQKYCKKTE